MRVIRRRGDFGIKVEVAGRGREPAPVVLARILERPIGRSGGLRDPLPNKQLRDAYVSVAVTREMRRWIKRQADMRGLCPSAFLGLIIEHAQQMSIDGLDDLLAREPAN